MFNSTADLEQAGFQGFFPAHVLYQNPLLIPAAKGVYAAVKPNGYKPVYLEIGHGPELYAGHKNPNVALELLHPRWIDDTVVLYFGKAGTPAGRATLRSRLKMFIKFGFGYDCAHWGGRYLWQLEGSQEFLFCWKVLYNEIPRNIETALIEAHRQHYHHRPFANING